VGTLARSIATGWGLTMLVCVGRRYFSATSQIMWILADADSPRSPTPTEAEASIAALTGENRTVWANARAEFFSYGINRQSLDMIESAIFVLSLDHENHPGAYMCRVMRHAQGRLLQTAWPLSESFCLRAAFRRRLLGLGPLAFPRRWHQPVVRQVVQPCHLSQRQGRPAHRARVGRRAWYSRPSGGL